MEQLDIIGAEHVEVLVKEDGKVLWVNVNGMCALRICKIDSLIVKDNREKKNHKAMK